jgi:hypothetical protein
MLTLYFASSGESEALLGARFCFYFRHDIFIFCFYFFALFDDRIIVIRFPSNFGN